MLVHKRSDIGMIRETNEDSLISQQPLFLVADGMGGHVAGEVASRLAAETVGRRVAEAGGTGNWRQLLQEAISEANAVIFRLAREREECAGMGTTVTAAYIVDAVLYWGHVGDSRLYLLRDGSLTQLTEDHSLVEELVKSGSITADEALTHPHRNILTRAVGTAETVKVDTGELPLTGGETLLLCTDGLTNMVSDKDIRAILAGEGSDPAAALIEQANAAGGIDNITAIVVRPGVG